MTPTGRGSTRALAAEYLDSALSALLMLVGMVVAGTAGYHPLSAASQWLLALLIVLRVAVPVLHWSTTTCTIGAGGIDVRSGVVRRRRRVVTWSQLSTVDLRRDWAHRLMGTARITVSQNGSETGVVTLPMMTLAAAEALRARTVSSLGRDTDRAVDRLALGAPSDDAAGSVDDTPTGRVVQVRNRDVAVTGLVLGTPAVLGVGAVLGGVEAARTWGLAPGLWEMVRLSPVAGAGLLLAAALLLGVVATVLRFGAFETEVVDGSVTLRHGYLDRSERRLDRHTLLGLELRQSPLERALGRWRLLVVTRDSVGGLGHTLVLPSLDERSLRAAAAPEWSEVVESHLSEPEGGGAGSNGRVELLGLSVVLAAATVLVGVGVVPIDASPWMSVVAWLAVVVMGGQVGLRVTSRLSVSPTGHLVIRRAFGGRRVTWLRGDSLGPVSTGSVAGLAGHVAVSYYAGAPRVARTWRLDASDVDAVRVLARREAPPRREGS